MNRLYELEMQNLQDCWSLLYYSLANAVLCSSNPDSEMLLRKSVRMYGKAIGSKEQSIHLQSSVKVNLKNFFINPGAHSDDPRIYVEVQRLDEEVALFDILRCPFAMLVRQLDNKVCGKVFCEEYTHACMSAYTNDVAQVNITETLSEPKDSHCRVAVYFRLANVKSDLHRMHFDLHSHPQTVSLSIDRHTIWSQNANILVRSFIQAGVEKETIDLGMTGAAQRIADFLRARASSTGQVFDNLFTANNCPQQEQLLQKISATVSI